MMLIRNLSKQLAISRLHLLSLGTENSIAQTNNKHELISPDKLTRAVFTVNDKGDLTYSLD